MKARFIARKRSGDYIIADFLETTWELVEICKTPKELKDRVNDLSEATLIVREYDKWSKTCKAIEYTEKQALKDFGYSASQKNINEMF
jgi:hypothetical protein